MTKSTPIERLMSKVVVDDLGCWIFSGALRNGYGHLGLPGRRTTYAHRLAYQELVGPIPDGMQLDHLCRNRACCNPAHLEPVTQRENLLRGDSPMARGSRKTECVRGHPLSGENLYLQGNHRSCRICRTERNRARYQNGPVA